MAKAPRTMAALVAVAIVAVAIVAAPVATADPDIDSESAAEVIQELQEQGYDVEVKGVSAPNTALLASCRVTAINNPGDPSPDPTTTTTIYVEVACPIQHS